MEEIILSTIYNMMITIKIIIPITIIVVIITICICNKKKRKKENLKEQKEDKKYEQPQPLPDNQQQITQQQNETPNYQQQNYQQFFPYQRKYLLTRNEYYFYKKLIPIANKHGLQILTKIRLADLVETKKNLSYADSNAYFNKIRSKHIDFALVDNMKVVALIELDDNSHKYQSRIERDIFVDDVLQRCGYTIIHTYGDTNQIDCIANSYRNT